jgi:hypothetical protein
MSGTATLLRVEQPAPVGGSFRSSRAQKIVAVLMMFIGAAFVALTLIVNLFKVGPAFERLTDGFRPIMTQQSIATARTDIARLGAAGSEFQTKLGPALAQQLKLTPTQLGAMMTANFPDTVAGVGQLPAITTTFNGLVTTLDQQRALFASADAIPTKNLPATTLPWALLAAGLVTFGLGLYAWFAPRAGAVVALVLGAVMIAAPLALSMTQKAADADQMNTNLKPVYTQQTVTQGTQALGVVTAMGTEMQTKMLPAVASQLKMTPAQFQSFVAANFPATATALQSLPQASQRFTTMISVFKAHLSDYGTLKPVALVPIVWMMIAGGIGLVLVGGTGLYVARR